MGRRKSDTIELKTDMKLKINGQTVDTRDILAFLAIQKNYLPSGHKLPMVVRKYRSLIWMKEQMDEYLAKVKEAIDSVPIPEWPDEAVIDSEVRKVLFAEDQISKSVMSQKMKLDADLVTDYRHALDKALKDAKKAYVRSPYCVA